MERQRHGRRSMMRPFGVIALAAALIAGLALTSRYTRPWDPDVATATPTITAPPMKLFSWAMSDRVGGPRGSTNSALATNSIESMIKPWIAADYLRRQA